MKQFFGVAGVVLTAAVWASAQDDNMRTKMKLEAEQLMAQVKTFSFNGLVMGPTTKGAPYSATEISERTQVLADGTRIHTEHQATVCRDSEGRLRRETPEEITIMDPVSGTGYVLHPKDQTARKLQFKSSWSYSPNGVSGSYTVSSGGKVAAGRMATEISEARKAPGDVPVPENVTLRLDGDRATTEARTVMIRRGGAGGANGESLGKQNMEGVMAEGTRHKSTLEVGAIGNDRPIQTVSESWFSPELQTMIMSKHSDPRTGEDSFRLVNINRSEPPAYLFQLPAGYQMVESKLDVDRK